MYISFAIFSTRNTIHNFAAQIGFKFQTIKQLKKMPPVKKIRETLKYWAKKLNKTEQKFKRGRGKFTFFQFDNGVNGR
jgi:hypothetical protein